MSTIRLASIVSIEVDGYDRIGIHLDTELMGPIDYRYHHITYISFAFICLMIKYIQLYHCNMDTQFAHICIIKSGD